MADEWKTWVTFPLILPVEVEPGGLRRARAGVVIVFTSGQGGAALHFEPIHHMLDEVFERGDDGFL